MSKCRECSGGRRFHGRPLIATGSEVAMTVDAYEQLSADGIKARVVSMPSWELFDKQPRSYRDEVLPPSVTARASVVKGSTFSWDRWVGPTGAIIGGRRFEFPAFEFPAGFEPALPPPEADGLVIADALWCPTWAFPRVSRLRRPQPLCGARTVRGPNRRSSSLRPRAPTHLAARHPIPRSAFGAAGSASALPTESRTELACRSTKRVKTCWA